MTRARGTGSGKKEPKAAVPITAKVLAIGTSSVTGKSSD